MGHQPLHHSKNSVFNTLAYRAKVVSTNQQALHKEMEHIRTPLQACSFPPWSLNSLHNKINCKHSIHNGQNSWQPTQQQQQQWNKQEEEEHLHSGTLHPWAGERFKKAINNMGIQVLFKGTNTLKTLLMAPQDRDSKLQKSGVIYIFKCPHITCPEKYIGESGKTFGEDKWPFT